MKEIKLITLAVLACVLTFTSCKQDEPDELKFSTLSVEENKSIIEDTGFSMLDEMENMEDLELITVMESFESFASESDPFEENEDSDFDFINIEKELGITVLKSINNNSKNGIKGIVNSLAVADDEPETIQEMFDMLAGVYEWNSTTGDWDYSSNSDNIEFKFPSTENGTENNVLYVLTYEGVVVNNTLIEDQYNGDLPKHVSYTLSVDGTELSEIDLKIDYDSDGYPTTINASLDAEEYHIEVNATNSKNEKGEIEFLWKNDETTIIHAKMEAFGDWSEANIEDNTKYYYGSYDEYWNWVEVEVTKDDEYDSAETQYYKVINNGNASIQLMDIKVTGTIDYEKLGKGIEDLEEEYDSDEDIDEERYNDESVALINENMNLTLINVDRNEIIAKCEAYIIEDSYSYYIGSTEYEEIEYYLGFRFVFADGSKIDAETYFEDGFDDLIDDFTDYFGDKEDDYDF